MEKLNVTSRVQWLTRDPLRFKLRFKRFTPLDWCSCRAVASHRIGARNWLCLSYIITSRRTAKFNQKIYKGSLSESVRDGEREMTANKIRSCQKLFSQKAKKCPIHYSAPSFMFNGDLRRTRERMKSKVGCCVLVTTDFHCMDKKHSKYLRKSYTFGTIWGNDNFGWTISLNSYKSNYLALWCQRQHISYILFIVFKSFEKKNRNSWNICYNMM